jgi:3-oxoacyl-[acyl-carrier-protein] synthase-3
MTKLQRPYVVASGSYVPKKVVSNEDLEGLCGTNAAWVRENLGISQRRIAEDGELTSDLAAAASKAAIADAGISPLDLDLIIVATASPDRLAPSTACIVQDKIGARCAAAFDMNAVCSGFLYALATGASFVSSSQMRRVMVVGADCFSRFTDWSRRDAPFFGDGAGAVILSGSSGERGFQSFVLGADGSGKDGFTITGGGSEVISSPNTSVEASQYYLMNARAVYDTATKVLPQAIQRLLVDNGMDIDDIHHILLHQASMKVVRKIAESIGAPMEKVPTNMSVYANTASATVAILLDEAFRSGKISPGENVLFGAVGSGWTWGAGLYRY